MADPRPLSSDTIVCEDLVKLFAFEREKLRVSEVAMSKAQCEESEALYHSLATTVKSLASVLVDEEKLCRGIRGHFQAFVRETERAVVAIVESYVGRTRQLEEDVSRVWRRAEERILEMERLCREDAVSGIGSDGSSHSPGRSDGEGKLEKRLIGVSSIGRIRKRSRASKIAFSRWTPHHVFTLSSLIPHTKKSIKGRQRSSRDRRRNCREAFVLDVSSSKLETNVPRQSGESVESVIESKSHAVTTSKEKITAINSKTYIARPDTGKTINSRACVARHSKEAICNPVISKVTVQRPSKERITSTSNAINSKTYTARQGKGTSHNPINSKTYIARQASAKSSKPIKDSVTTRNCDSARTRMTVASNDSILSSTESISSDSTYINSRTHVDRSSSKTSIASCKTYIVANCAEPKRNLTLPEPVPTDIRSPKRNHTSPAVASSVEMVEIQSDAPPKRNHTLPSVASTMKNTEIQSDASPRTDLLPPLVASCPETVKTQHDPTKKKVTFTASESVPGVEIFDRRKQFRNNTRTCVRVRKPLPFGPKSPALRLPRVKQRGAWGLAWHQKLAEGRELNAGDRAQRREYAVRRLRDSYRVLDETVGMWEERTEGCEPISSRAVPVPSNGPEPEEGDPFERFFRGAELRMYPRWAQAGVYRGAAHFFTND